MMNGIKSHTLAFTGHRRFDGGTIQPLAEAVAMMYERGYRVFMSGMAVGFDLAAAECVIDYRTAHPDVRLCCVAPFRGQQSMYSATDCARYEQIMAVADDVVCLAEEYSNGCYARRNDFLVDNASAVIAYFDGSKGGTHYTVRRAERNRLAVVNIFPDPQLKIPEL